MEKAVAVSMRVLTEARDVKLESLQQKNPCSSNRAGTRCLEAHFQIIEWEARLNGLAASPQRFNSSIIQVHRHITKA